ncbi:Hypothetical predicted protein, partial [Argonauta hians]
MMMAEEEFLRTWRVKKKEKVGKNIVSMTKEQYNKYMLILKGAWDKKTAWTGEEYNVTRRFDLFTDEQGTKLVKKRTEKDPESVRPYIADEDLYRALKIVHLTHAHAGINRMQNITRQLYANVTAEAIKIYISLCPRCSARRHGNCKNFRSKTSTFSYSHINKSAKMLMKRQNVESEQQQQHQPAPSDLFMLGLIKNEQNIVMENLEISMKQEPSDISPELQ